MLAIVLVGGFAADLPLGLRQLALARQQQDFVSAVSHELKTPLTSIRMYGEMLREGWADEDKRRTYYDFIFHEAERLTRLINNVLQLARLSRNEAAPLDVWRCRGAGRARAAAAPSSSRPVSGLSDRPGDEAALDSTSTRLVHPDFHQPGRQCGQVFRQRREPRASNSAATVLADDRMQFSVRDYGPGIAADQMKKIFQLFYRSENELTRETVGTGIGLALVHQLAATMRADVDVVNRDPGA